MGGLVLGSLIVDWFCFNFRIIVKDTFDEDDGVANVVSLVRDDDVDVIFGSPSSKGKFVTVKPVLSGPS